MCRIELSILKILFNGLQHGEQVYAFEGGKGANVLPLFYKRGQMSTILHLLRGQMSSPVNHLGGRCPHIPFFTGGQMSEGGNVRLPFITKA